MGRSTAILSLTLVCCVLAASAVPQRVSRALRSNGALADDLESMRQRLMTSENLQAQNSRALKQAYPYASEGYGYGYYYGGYSNSYDGMAMRRSRSLLGENGRELLQAYPYATTYGYGYYGYYSESNTYSARRRMLSDKVDVLSEILDDGADGFVEPGQDSILAVAEARRALLQYEYPYSGGNYGYGYYYGGSAPYTMAM